LVLNGRHVLNVFNSSALAELFGLSSLPHDGGDLTRIEQLAAAIDSANYLNTEMSGCTRFQNSFDLLAKSMNARSIQEGLILEFGVFSGRSINHIASQTSATVFGFDRFEGLPEDWRPEFGKGAFRRSSFPEVVSNVSLVVGWFDDTLPKFLEHHEGPVSFLHVDCDLYSSTSSVFRLLKGRVVPGTVIVFDEYFNYVGWRNHEFKAFTEFIMTSKLKYRYIGVVPSHQQVAVEIY
jgi:predicted O-methyltransferase YrrM